MDGPDKPAEATSDDKERRRHDRRRGRSRTQLGLIGLLYGLLVIGASLVVNNLRNIQDLGVELTRLQSEVKGLALKDELLQRDVQTRIDTLEKTLFGGIVTKLEKQALLPPPNRIEVWQLNRDREMRNRLLALEQWRLRTEKK